LVVWFFYSIFVVFKISNQLIHKIMSLKKITILESSVERPFDANETYALLRQRQQWLWSWGARNFTKFTDKAFFFTVSGHHHKGIVLITLGWNDTYTVRLLSSQWNLKDTITDVYFDQLSEIIDNKVERIAEYER